MGMRGEIKSYKLADKNFTYFINIKEDRYKTIFLNLVLSERVDTGYKRQEVLVYKEDFDTFLLELEKMKTAYDSELENDDESYHKAEFETDRRAYSFVLKGVVKNNKKNFSAKLTETLKFAPDKISNILIFERNFKELFKLIKNAINFIERLSEPE